MHPLTKHSIYGQYALPAILLPICDHLGSSSFSLDYFQVRVEIMFSRVQNPSCYSYTLL